MRRRGAGEVVLEDGCPARPYASVKYPGTLVSTAAITLSSAPRRAARAPKDGELLRVALWMERNRGGATEHGHKASESTDEKVERERKQVEDVYRVRRKRVCHRRPAMEIADVSLDFGNAPRVGSVVDSSPGVVRRSTLRESAYRGCERGLVCRRRAREVV